MEKGVCEVIKIVELRRLEPARMPPRYCCINQQRDEACERGRVEGLSNSANPSTNGARSRHWGLRDSKTRRALPVKVGSLLVLTSQGHQRILLHRGRDELKPGG